jgi:hypothetical protein
LPPREGLKWKARSEARTWNGKVLSEKANHFEDFFY